MNVFAVDWSNLAQSPCYPGAVWNSRFVGKCSAQLVDRIRELGARDIHVIGFSLGNKYFYVSATILLLVIIRTTNMERIFHMQFKNCFALGVC